MPMPMPYVLFLEHMAFVEVAVNSGLPHRQTFSYAVPEGITLTPGDGVPTDIDGDGYADTAFMEVWYNNGFTWTLTGVGGTDVQTAALHENGHALGLGHYGKVHATFPPPKEFGLLHISPRAVMNGSVTRSYDTLVPTVAANAMSTTTTRPTRPFTLGRTRGEPNARWGMAMATASR